ncbi:hypothetical protein KBY90_08520 [Cyanobium sp. CH-040]|nr:hypothetical protein [Cyanobium sp. CH-040]
MRAAIPRCEHDSDAETVRSVMDALQERARRHGRSMEKEVRLIQCRAVERGEPPPQRPMGLGSRMAALFADAAPAGPGGGALLATGHSQRPSAPVSPATPA